MDPTKAAHRQQWRNDHGHNRKATPNPPFHLNERYSSLDERPNLLKNALKKPLRRFRRSA